MQAGCSIDSAYPGTPAPRFYKPSKYKGYSEWSVNEKVAAEVAIGVAVSARAMAAMKHFGMNVASDAVFPSRVYQGHRRHGVIMRRRPRHGTAPAPSPTNRHFAPHMKITCWRSLPTTRSYWDFTKRAFELSKQFDTPSCCAPPSGKPRRRHRHPGGRVEVPVRALWAGHSYKQHPRPGPEQAQDRVDRCGCGFSTRRT